MELCSYCHTREAKRTYKSKPYCILCEAVSTAPIYREYGFTKIYRVYPSYRLDSGWYIKCNRCGADWVGSLSDNECQWCVGKEQRMREEERKRLLWPSWAVARNGARYEALDEESKAIWRETRGQSVSADTQVTWVDELAMGIQAGLITKDEAREAIKRIGLD